MKLILTFFRQRNEQTAIYRQSGVKCLQGNTEDDLLQQIHGTCWFIYRFDEMRMMSSRTNAVIVLLVSSKPIKTGLGLLLPNMWNNYHSSLSNGVIPL